mmetsp:Transcript_36356/g.116630  ORF Transcript_36356/g.116630 Transcript_36356/m.116630 type:complete len:109 (+) Transcript_36356:584-910(+)
MELATGNSKDFALVGCLRVWGVLQETLKGQNKLCDVQGNGAVDVKQGPSASASGGGANAQALPASGSQQADEGQPVASADVEIEDDATHAATNVDENEIAPPSPPKAN